MKTVRFSKVVERCGQPETYLLLVDPKKDRALQTAVKAQRVMTIHQEAVGTKTDRGEVGFSPGRARQFFIFPKSLRSFAGRAVVGIKYDLLSSPDIPKGQRAPPPHPPKKVKPKRPTVLADKPAPPGKEKVVAFQPEPPEEGDDEAITDLKRQVRHAMDVLEAGKPVAAFNLLKRIVGD